MFVELPVEKWRRFLSATQWKSDVTRWLSTCYVASWRRERDSNPRYLSVRRFSRPVHSTTLPSLHRVFEIAVLAVKKVNHLKASLHCGERGIRTPGTSQYAGFQDRCIRPLCHLSNRGNAIDVALQSQWITIPLCFISGCKVTLFSSYLQIFGLLFSSISEKTLVSTHFTASEAAWNTSINREHPKNMQAYFVLSSVCSNSE